MSSYRIFTIAFKRQVAQEYLAGVSLNALSRKHEVARNLIRIWVAKYQGGEFEPDFVPMPCMSTAGIAIQTLIQLAADHSMRGRVMGLYGLIFRGAPAIGALGAGLASAHFGLRWTVFFGAMLVIAVCLWTYSSRERIAVSLQTQASDPTA
jgi:MFS family permease